MFIWYFFAVLFVFLPSATLAETIEVQIKNITNGQTMTPPLIAAGACTTSVFSLGNAASSKIERLAEGGDTNSLAAWFRGVGWITHTGSSPIYPGQWYVIRLYAPVVTPQSNLCLFVGGMLVPTNDGFYAIQNLRVHGNLGKTLYLPGYDAGTEYNSELCFEMPAPDACGFLGEGYNPTRDPQEGRIVFHPGILGIGNIDRATNYFDNRTVGILRIYLK